MIIKVFRENQTFTLLFSILVSLFVWALVGYFKPYEPDYQTLFNTSLFYLFPQLKNINTYRIICSTTNIIFIFINGIYLSRLSYKYQLFSRRNLLPLFFFLTLSSPYFLAYSGISYSLLSITVLLKVISILFSTLEKQKTSYGYFDSALLISLISIFNFYSIFLVLFLIYVLIEFKGPQLREFLFIIVGILVPYILFIAFLYLVDLDLKAFIQSYAQMFSMKTTFPINTALVILGAFTGLMLIISSVKMINSFIKMKIVTRKYSIVFFGFFISSLLIALFYPITDRDILFYLILPVSYLFAHYFTNCKPSLINQVLFLLIIASNLFVLIYA